MVSAGEALDAIPLPPAVDIGDAIKAMKSLYSVLRQLEWALKQPVSESPDGRLAHVAETVSQAVRSMERDVIKRT